MGHATERGAHHGADPVEVLAPQVQRRIAQGHAGGGDGELGIAVEPARAPLLDVVGGVKPVHLARDPGLEHRRVESGDGPDGRSPAAESLPQPLGAEADRRDRSDAGDDDATAVVHPIFPPRRPAAARRLPHAA
jgi:hypothetical protein